MHLTIRTSNNQTILLSPGVSAGDYYELPGAKSWFSETEYGNLYFQEKKVGPFTIRLSLLQFIKKVTLYFRNQQPMAGVRIALENRWNVGLWGGEMLTLREKQFVLFSPGTKGEKMTFEKDQVYRGIEVLCDSEKLGDLMDLFPGIAEYVGDGEDNSIFLQKKPVWAPDRALDMVQELVGLDSDDNLFLLMNFLLMQVEHVMEEKLPTIEEIEAADRAEKLILKDIRIHHGIPVIANSVKLNENRLKYVFRHVFKTSIYQYLLGARMEKAKFMLQHTNMSMTEVAKACGYRYLTSFITTFRKFYGYTPRSVKRPENKSYFN
jgi:AraC family transcriptional regulator, transcriptional activator of the genes for pyochelin and ferripyochelin receptors